MSLSLFGTRNKKLEKEVASWLLNFLKELMIYMMLFWHQNYGINRILEKMYWKSFSLALLKNRLD